MTGPDQVEAMARLLCLACGENPDSDVQRHVYPVETAWTKLWLHKYKPTAERLVRMGFTIPRLLSPVCDFDGRS